MSDPLNPEAIFLQHLSWIDKVAATACRRGGVWGVDAEDFAAWVKVRLMEDDYVLLRKYRGESDQKTYIAVVVARMFSAYMREQHGRWRPSAEAVRIGPPAPALEMLVRRDGYTLEQAGQQLRTAGKSALSDLDLARILARLPERMPLRPVNVEAAPIFESAEAESYADSRVVDSEAEAWRGGLLSALDRAVGHLDPEAQMIVRMHFGEGLPIADVARALGIEQKPLYRRINKLRNSLRENLEGEGVSAHEVRALLAGEERFSQEISRVDREEETGDFQHPGILGPNGLPITQEDLQGSRIITDVLSINTRLLRMVQDNPDMMYDISSRQFEELVAELLDHQGYEIVLTPPSNDGGFDMYAARKDGIGEFLYLVECKRYAPTRPVGVDIVRSLYGVVEQHRATAGLLVTTSRFTRGAAEYQRSVQHRLSLRDYRDLHEWLELARYEPTDGGLVVVGA